MTFKLLYRAAKGEFEEAILELQRPIAEAATAAMQDVAAGIKFEGRREIARAGFSKRWQNALRVDTFPRGKRVSIDAAALAFHKIPYAEVFEAGATIRGKPTLWLPLPGSPKKIARRRITPDLFSEHIGPLAYVEGRGGSRLLVAPAALSRAQAKKARPKVSLAALRRGAAKIKGGRTVTRRVPIFHGPSVVEVPKKFDVLGVVAKGANRLADAYLKRIGERT